MGIRTSKKHPDKALSVLGIRAIERPGRYADGNGLYLKVDASGAKRWELRTVVRGKRCDIGLGGLKAVTLAEAREEARKYRAIARNDGDPLAEKRQRPEGGTNVSPGRRNRPQGTCEGVEEYKTRRPVDQHAEGLRLSGLWRSPGRPDRYSRDPQGVVANLANETGNGTAGSAADRDRTRLGQGRRLPRREQSGLRNQQGIAAAVRAEGAPRSHALCRGAGVRAGTAPRRRRDHPGSGL